MGKLYAQLYSLIRQQRETTLEAIQAVAELGYDGVELLSTATGDLKPAEFRTYLDSLGLKVISTQGYNNEEDLAFGQEIGLKYCTYGHVAVSKKPDDVLRTAQLLNENGKITARYGMKLVVHNHANEFMYLEGEEGGRRIYDLLLQNTDPALVGFEFDIGWGQLAGADCPAIIRQYPGRFPLIHVKECARVATSEEDFEHFPAKIFEYARQLDPDFAKPGKPPKFPPAAEKMMYESRNWNVALGEGLVDWKALYAAAEAQGTEAFISEREYYHITGNPEATARGAARADLTFMKNVFR